MAGICLIRLRDLRPGGAPTGLGLRTENAAHRVAVESDYPGRHHRATLTVSDSREPAEDAGTLAVAFTSRDAELDSALLMREVPVTWSAVGPPG